MTMAYDASRRALLQPERGPSVFAAGQPPPGPEALACEAARLAYVRVEESSTDLQRLTTALAAAGYGAPVPFNHAGSDGQGYGALHADGSALLAFRGTQPDRAGDLVIDANTVLKRWDLGAGRVHAGFRTTALGLWPEVQQWLDGAAARRTRLLVCGHSLGAAVATLLALPARASLLVTLGSPRVGDAAFAASLAGLPHTRIVDCCDLVTQVPPPGLGFKHAGPPLYIDHEGGRHDNPADDFVDADRQLGRKAYLSKYAFRFGTVLARELADHAPVNYLRAFWP